MDVKKKTNLTNYSRAPRSNGNKKLSPKASKTPKSTNSPNPNPNYKPPIGGKK